MIEMVWICIKWIIAAGLAVITLVLAYYVVTFIVIIIGKLLASPFTMWKEAKETGTTKQTIWLLGIAGFCVVIFFIYIFNP